MKRIAFILSLTVIVFFTCQLKALAECTDGKIPVQITTPSGKTKTLCVSQTAANGIENATENSATTIVPATCPEICWTAEFIEVLAQKGTLECEYTPGEYNCYLYNESGEIEYRLGMKLYNDGTGYCATEAGAGTYIDQDEIDACLAILEPYDVSVSCPCWTEDELARIASTKGYVCEETEGYILCQDGTNKLVAVTKDKDITTECTNFVSGVTIRELSPEEGYSCAEDLR